MTDDASLAVTELVLRAKDPLRDLAWALLTSGPPSAGPLAAELVAEIVAEFEDAEARAKEEEARQLLAELQKQKKKLRHVPDPNSTARRQQKQQEIQQKQKNNAKMQGTGMTSNDLQNARAGLKHR